MGVLDLADLLEDMGFKLAAKLCRWSPLGLGERGINYIFDRLDKCTQGGGNEIR